MQKKPRSTNKLFQYAIIIAIVVGLGAWLYKNLVKTSQIAEISISDLQTSGCTSQVSSFTASTACSSEGYSTYSYMCGGQTDVKTISNTGGTCISFDEAYAKASSVCTICVTPLRSTLPTPSISPMVSSTPTPASPPPACRAQELTHFAYREICSPTGGSETQYRYIDFTCGDEKTPRSYGDGANCYFERSLKSTAEYFCRRNACVISTPVASSRATPTPTPTPRVTTMPAPRVSSRPNPSPVTLWPPTPPPTSDPSPLVSCALEVYKIPTNLPLSQAFMLPEYQVRQGNISAKPGERYVVSMALTNVKNYALTSGNLKFTSWSTNSLAGNAPYSVFSTGVNTCTQGYPDKSVRCEVPRLTMRVGETVRPESLVVFDINSKVERAVSNSVSFKGIYSASTVTCPSVNFNVTPATVRRCYGFGRFQWCRNVVAK